MQEVSKYNSGKRNKDIEIVVQKKDCCGCYACVNVCPKKCIEMKEDKAGFLHPVIDRGQCIHCGKCYHVCPSIHKEELGFQNPKQAFAVWSLNADLRNASSSGGFATQVGRWMIEKKGIVYAAVIANNAEVLHKRISKTSELKSMQGSKYVHSKIGTTYTECKKDLENGTQVVFIGTGCQIAGLKRYLGKKYQNLLTIDLICHGVPSQKMLRDSIKHLVGDSNIETFSCRKGTRYILTAYKENKEYRDRLFYDRYMRAFLDGVISRENCYKCPYAASQRVSDITIGDFWGLGELKSVQKEESKGINVVLLNTENGALLFDEIKEKFFTEERPVEEAIKGNDQLNHPAKMSEKREWFLQCYTGGMDFTRAVDTVYHINWIKKIQMLSENVRKKFLH